MNDSDNRIKICLENAYDIPFEVTSRGIPSEPSFYIRPAGEKDSLLTINVTIRQQTRLIAEIRPERYAADLVRAMESCSVEKKNQFMAFKQQLIKNGATVDIKINGQQAFSLFPPSAPVNWTEFYIRVSKSPVTKEDEPFNSMAIASKWVVPITGMVLSLLEVVPVEEAENEPRLEGAAHDVVVTKYERNPLNRALCIMANGCFCNICGFDFEKHYGDIGRGFIHVHHIRPVSTYDGPVEIDPVKDLIPVCPNCHAMLHQETPPIMPEDLKSLLKV